MDNLKPVNIDYLYVTIPANYVCLYNRILVLMADYGVSMLQDCYANCKDKNKSIIEVFNMFNSAVAANKLGDTKLADTLIKYVDAKINQLSNNYQPSNEIIFPIENNGITGYVKCNCETNTAQFYVDGDKTFNVNYNGLLNVISTNTSQTVAVSDKYETVLSSIAAYPLYDVIVMMGGVNITSTAYSNGKVIINNVTGDIELYAKAKSPTLSYYGVIPLINVNSTNVDFSSLISNLTFTVTSLKNTVQAVTTTDINDSFIIISNELLSFKVASIYTELNYKQITYNGVVYNVYYSDSLNPSTTLLEVY